MKVKLLEPIEGYEDVAEWRHPQQGEYYLSQTERCLTKASHNFTCVCYLVLTTVKRWRKATIDDAVRAIKGEVVVARFRNHETSEWKQSRLVGYFTASDYKWMADSPAAGFFRCEVLDA